MELPDRAEDRSEYLEDTFVPNQALSGPRPFCERLLSSVAYGATFFQRKKAFSLRHEAQETQGKSRNAVFILIAEGDTTTL
jgi:hypothetical protein